MFSYEEIQKFNETEILIYKFIISNIEKIPYMTIRELASDIHISTSTLLRFCNKNGFEGYSEFKKAINDEIHLLKTQPPLEDLQELNLFFQRTNSSAFERKLSSAIEIIKNSDYLIFIGNGSSGTLAKYGARLFSNMGKFSVGLEDTFYPIETYSYKNAVIIALSESGETNGVVDMVRQFQQKKCMVLSITNAPNSTLAQISDWSFSYNIKEQRVNGNYNATTQVPTLFILECLARRI